MRMQSQNAFDPLHDDAKLVSLRAAVDREGGNLILRIELAQSYEGYGLNDLALETYLSLLRTIRTDSNPAEQPLNLSAMLGLARNALRASRPGEAIAMLEPELAAAASAELYLQMGLLYDRIGNSAKAEAAYREAVRLNPANGAGRNNLGYRLMKRGNLLEAELQFRAAIAGTSGSIAARNNLGLLLTLRGDLTAAWEQFLAAGTDQAAARNNFAVALMNAGKWLESREQLALALREHHGFAPALENFRIVQDHLRSGASATESAVGLPNHATGQAGSEPSGTMVSGLQ